MISKAPVLNKVIKLIKMVLTVKDVAL